MYRAVVKLNTLTNTDWTGTKNHHFLPVRYDNFIFCSIGRVIIWSVGFKLCSTGINHFVGWYDSPSFAHFTDFKSCFSYIFTDCYISEAHFLSFTHQFFCHRFILDNFFHINNVVNLTQEEAVNFGNQVNFFQCFATAESFSNYEEAFIVDIFNLIKYFFIGKKLEFRYFQMCQADFQRTYGFQHCCFHISFD
ncbi:hypothetical protein SDC9_168698 [bioreactor metagenome]|uniref:Uncharacterized protein n=1 Tax=bioreactor metagenome TaxID=1076179 RepID=A0A645G690_9ZZZZ